MERNHSSRGGSANGAPRRGRGSNRARGPRFASSRLMHAVPAWAELSLNAPVSIVLKKDQPSGRQVKGFIAELLGRGNHPRGVKVMLTDGRVGRVQGFASHEDAMAGTAGPGVRLGRDGDMATGFGSENGETLSRARVNRYDDVRTDGYSYEDRPGAGDAVDLLAYVKEKPRRQKKGKAGQTRTPGATDSHEMGIEGVASRPRLYKERDKVDTPGQTHIEWRDDMPPSVGEYKALSDAAEARENSVCPVCQTFEGDEEAVTRHVATHFD